MHVLPTNQINDVDISGYEFLGWVEGGRVPPAFPKYVKPYFVHSVLYLVNISLCIHQ